MIKNIPNTDFAVLVGETVSFRFFSSAARAGDRSGDVLESCEDLLEETSSLTRGSISKVQKLAS